AGGERPALRVEPAGDIVDARKFKRPEGEIDEVDAEVDDAAAAGERRVAEPRLVGTVGVVEDEVDGIDAANVAGRDEASDASHRLRVPVREIDAEQPVSATCGGDDAGAFLRR